MYIIATRTSANTPKLIRSSYKCTNLVSTEMYIKSKTVEHHAAAPQLITQQCKCYKPKGDASGIQNRLHCLVLLAHQLAIQYTCEGLH